MGKKKVMDLSLGDTDYVALGDSKFSSSTPDENKSTEIEKTAPVSYTLPMIDVALLKAAAFQMRTDKGGRASASAVLANILKEHRAKLLEECDEYMLIGTLRQMTKDLPEPEQIKAILSGKVASL